MNPLFRPLFFVVAATLMALSAHAETQAQSLAHKAQTLKKQQKIAPNNAKKLNPKTIATRKTNKKITAPAKKSPTHRAVAKKSTSAQLTPRQKPETSAPLVDKVPLYSSAVLVVDNQSQAVLLSKNQQQQMPIASLTKLMTTMVVLDAHQDENEVIAIAEEDIDTIKNTHSRLFVGLHLRRKDAMLLALMSSENRAANALARHYPGGYRAFVSAMNQKAAMLGMTRTHFIDATGLSPENVSTPEDLSQLVQSALLYPTIREYSTTRSAEVLANEHAMIFKNTNPFIAREQQSSMNIELSKTGHINESGYCLVLSTLVNAKRFTVVLMSAASKAKRTHDLARIAQFVQTALIR